MDGAANCWSFSLGANNSLLTSWSRLHLRWTLSQTGKESRDWGNYNGPALTLAESVCRTRYWLNPPRVSESHIVLNEGHLRRQLKQYFVYYHEARTHLSLGRQCPQTRVAQSPEKGRVIAFPHVGGLHHEYRRAAWCVFDIAVRGRTVNNLGQSIW